jgi:molybdopterin-containing oxidoreductase family iron-sulfur binding subunit
VQISKIFAKVSTVIAVTDKKNEIAKQQKCYSFNTLVRILGRYRTSNWCIFINAAYYPKNFKSRQIEESLLVWMNGKGNAANNYYEYLKANAPSILGGTSFNQALYNGFNAGNVTGNLSYAGGDAAKASSELKAFKASELELVLYTKTSMGDGTQANNPWLQELPDPITRMSWDNYLTISPKDAKKFGIENELNARMQLDGTVVNLKVNGVTIENVPVFIQPGQAEGSVGLALGYGKKDSGKVAETGVNAYPYLMDIIPLFLVLLLKKQMLMTTNLQECSFKIH